MQTLWQFVRLVLQKRPLESFFLLFLLIFLTFQLIWSPAPNSVEVLVSELEQENTSRPLQIYYQYDIPGLKGFREYQSEMALIHRSHQPLLTTFSLPGFHPLGDLRLDFGVGDGTLKIHQVSFYYEFGHLKYPLYTITPRQLATTWAPNDSVKIITANDDFVQIEVNGNDPFSLIALSPKNWENVLPIPAVLTILALKLILIAIAYCLLLAGVHILKSQWIRSAGTGDTPVWNFCAPPLFFVATALLGYYVYLPYLTGKNLYLFADVANDSVASFWPIYIHLSEYLRHENWPLWSFSLGTGRSIFDLLADPFAILHVFLPSDLFAFGFGWIQYLKVIVAAGLFFCWFRLLNVGRFACLFAATGLAFSAHMVIRGNWIHYATEVVVVAFALVAVELFLTRRIWQLVPFALVFLVSRGVFHTYVWTIILLSYVFCRLWLFYGNQYKHQINALFKLIFLYCVGLMISAAILVPNLFSLLGSARVSGDEASIGSFAAYSLFSLNEPRQWLASLYGLFAPDILGRGNFYTGWGNYLEGPHLYAGLFVLLLLPQVFIRRSARLRIVITLALSIAIAYIFLPWVRYGLNGFAGEYYKTSSFWISILLSCCAALAIDNIVRRRILNIWLLSATFALCLFSLLLLKFSPFITTFVRIGENTLVFQQVIVLLTCYYIFFTFLKFRTLRPYGFVLLICTLFLEVILFAGGSSQNRLALRGDAIETGGYYYDDSLKAVEKIKSDDNSFYRIEKTAPSVGFNDALAQNYFGVKSYNSFNSAAYLRFLGTNGFDINYHHYKTHNTAYIRGLDNQYILETLLSVKYYISLEKHSALVPQNYTFTEKIGDYLIYENNNFIPLGFVYHTIATETQARSLPPEERELLALQSAIVTDDTLETTKLPVTPEGSANQLQSFIGNSTDAGKLKYFTEKSKELVLSSMEMVNYSQNHFEGTITVDRPGLLFLSIPAEKGWTFSVDDVQTKAIRTNFGFYGIELPTGSFRISGRYFPPLLSFGLYLSVVGIAVYLLLIVWVLCSSRAKRMVTPSRLAQSTVKGD